MGRTGGSQSELGMLYQYGVTVLLAGYLSTNDKVEDYVIYSSEKSAGKFDDVIARVKLKDQQDWYLSLIQVKYKESKKLNVSDNLIGKTVAYFLSDYIESFNNIMDDSTVTCRWNIPSDNIRFSIFSDKSIQIPVFLRQECTFQLGLSKYAEKDNVTNILLPFSNKYWRFCCKDLEKTQHQRFFNKCFLCLEQPNYSQINKHIQKICEIANGKEIINYVKDYFNNDYLYKHGLTKEVFEIELQRIRLCDSVPPLIQFEDLVGDTQIATCIEVILQHDVSVVNYNEGIQAERCLYSCLVRQLNLLLNINIDWTACLHKNLGKEVVNQFVAFSKSKPRRYWISPPNTLRSLMIELWKTGDMPLILKTNRKLAIFEKYAHLRRSYILIDDWVHRSDEICASNLKIFSSLNSIVNKESRDKMVRSIFVSSQGRGVASLKDLLADDEELMSTFTVTDIMRLLQKRVLFLRDKCLNGNNYLGFIIEDGKCTGIVEPIQPHAVGNNVKIFCPPSQVENCFEATKLDSRYKHYIFYHLRRSNNLLELIRGDRDQINHAFMDQYENPLYSSKEDESIPIIGEPVMFEEPHYVPRYLKRATLLESSLNCRRKQICLLSGDLKVISSRIGFTNIDALSNLEALVEEKSYFFKIEKENRQHYWCKLDDVKWPTLDINVRDDKLELLRYKYCKNISLDISYDGEKFRDAIFFKELELGETNEMVVITGEPGIGKSSFLKSLARSCPIGSYVLFYDLIDFQSYLRQINEIMDPIEILFKEFHKKTPKTYNNFLSGILKQKRLILMLDSFDEVLAPCRNQLLEFIRCVRATGVQIILATRLEGCNILLDEFTVRAIKIDALNDYDSTSYLENWKLRKEELIDVPAELVTNPLYLNFLRMISVDLGQLTNINRFILYETVITLKIKRWLKKNSKIFYESEIERTTSVFERLALVAMFGKDDIEHELKWTYDEKMSDYIQYGIVTSFDEYNSPIFTHFSYIEFLVANWIAKAKQTRLYKNSAKYFYKRIYAEGRLYILNILSEDFWLHKAVLETDVSKVLTQGRESAEYWNIGDRLGRTALHLSVIKCGFATQRHIEYVLVNRIIKFMEDFGVNIDKRDEILEWNWADYVQVEVFEYACLYNCINIVKKYLRIQAEVVEKQHGSCPIFPMKNFDANFYWALETLSVDIIRDFVFLQNFTNRKFYYFYQVCIRTDLTSKIWSNKLYVSKVYVYGQLTPLHIACICGSTAVVQRLIEMNADVNAVDKFGWTPLLYSITQSSLVFTENTARLAASIGEYFMGSYNTAVSPEKDGNIDIIKLLLQNGADPNTMPPQMKPIYAAVQGENLEAVKILLQHGAVPNWRDKGNNTPLHVAARDGSWQIAQILLNYGADQHCQNIYRHTPLDVATIKNKQATVSVLSENIIVEQNFQTSIRDDIKNKKLDTSLHVAVRMGDINMVNSLLKKELINSLDQIGCTPIYYAIEYGNIEIMKLLLENGVDTTTCNNLQCTPLQRAGYIGNFEAVKVLIEYGASVNYRNTMNKTPLHYAALGMTFDIIQLLLEKGATVNSQCDMGLSPLQVAARYRDRDIVQLLLQKGAKINIGDKQNVTPLHVATESSCGCVIETLLKNGADVNAQDKQGMTPLHLAVQTRYSVIVKILLERGARVNLQTNEDQTPLHIALHKSDINIDIVKLLLEFGAIVTISGQYNSSPLHYAAYYGSAEVVKLLLEKGASANAEQFCKGTPLHRAAGQGRLDNAVLLLEHGANVNVVDVSNSSPLHYAVSAKHNDIVKLLLEKGANLNNQCKEGETPCTLAASTANEDILELLLEKGANTNISNKRGWTPLHIAVHDGLTNIIKLLLRKGADVNICTEYTALFLAAYTGRTAIAKLLLEAGANVNLRAENSSTPLHGASGRGHTDICDLLISNGANVNVETAEGDTPLHNAAKMGYAAIVSLLLENGADMSIKDHIGALPLHYATYEKYIDVVKLLLNDTRHINTQDSRGDTPLLNAISKYNESVFQVILEKGASVNLTNNHGRTPLLHAICAGNIEVVKLLLAKRAKMDVLHSSGHSPLSLAALHGLFDMAKLLLDAGANVNIATETGTTPLHMAASAGKVNLCKVLLERGANINATTNKGAVPLDVALTNKHADVIVLLLQNRAAVAVRHKIGITALGYANFILDE